MTRPKPKIGNIYLAGIIVSVGIISLLAGQDTAETKPSLPEPIRDTVPIDPNSLRACSDSPADQPTDIDTPVIPSDPNWLHPRSPERQEDRQVMVRQIQELYGFDDPNVLAAMRSVPRHWFVRQKEQRLAYADMPLPIGHGQTISQPFIVAYMTRLLNLTPQKKVLEIGTGSGYQAAVLTEFTPKVYTIEIVEPLAKAAQDQLTKHGYNTIRVKIGDGYEGWKEHAPFDAIIVTCAADHIPPPLIKQLKPNGKMCIPVGGAFHLQYLMLVQKDSDNKVTSQALMPVRFVPLTRHE